MPLLGSISADQLYGYLVRLFIIFLILPIHEFAHAWTASRLGDDTAKYQGRLTLNPLAHLDPVGAVCLLIGGFGWAKPVPIDPTRFTRKHSMRFGVAITALAGPLSNLIVAFLGMIGLRFYICSGYYRTYWEDFVAGESVNNAPSIIYSMLFAFVTINIGLAVFNLIPIPPLDGSKVLFSLVSDRAYYQLMRYERYGMILLYALVFTNLLGAPLRTAISFLTGRLLVFAEWGFALASRLYT